MQQTASLPDVAVKVPWRANYSRSVEGNCAVADFLEQRSVFTMAVPIRLYFIPVGVMARRERLAHSRRTVTQSDIAIAFARIAKLGEPPVFKSFDYRRWGGGAIRSGSV